MLEMAKQHSVVTMSHDSHLLHNTTITTVLVCYKMTRAEVEVVSKTGQFE